MTEFLGFANMKQVCFLFFFFFFFSFFYFIFFFLAQMPSLGTVNIFVSVSDFYPMEHVCCYLFLKQVPSTWTVGMFLTRLWSLVACSMCGWLVGFCLFFVTSALAGKYEYMYDSFRL